MASSFSPEDYYLRAIGQFTVAFSRLETFIAESIREFITDEYELAERITADMEFVQLVYLLKSLVKYRISDKASQKKFLSLIDKLFGINTTRVQYIHADWFLPHDDTKKPAILIKKSKRAKKGWDSDSKEKMLSEIFDSTHKIWFACNELTAIMEANRTTIKEHRAKNANRTATMITLEKLKALTK